MADGTSAILIDSGGGWFDAKKTTVGIFNKPSFTLTYCENGIQLSGRASNRTDLKNPLSLIEYYISVGYIAIGYIGYNYLESTNRGFKSKGKKEGFKFPQIIFHFYKSSEFKKIPLSELKNHLTLQAPIKADVLSDPVSNLSKKQYITKLKKIKDYIASGDIYQVNLSQRFYSTPIDNPVLYFLRLFGVQPTPYAIYIDLGDFQLISGSMELYLKRKGQLIGTKPVKGTARRGRDEKEDLLLKHGLYNSVKERAENIMIVDLVRNDLGRICEYGSVKVKNLFKINGYETLFQMESHIEGTLNPNTSFSDIIYNTFPPGSVTGAPKRRSLEIIDELEPHYRGPYCGATCFINSNGDFKMSVAIRVLINTKKESIFWVGSGVVWDSDPEKEYEETALKSVATLKAIKNKTLNF